MWSVRTLLVFCVLIGPSVDGSGITIDWEETGHYVCQEEAISSVTLNCPANDDVINIEYLEYGSCDSNGTVLSSTNASSYDDVIIRCEGRRHNCSFDNPDIHNYIYIRFTCVAADDIYSMCPDRELVIHGSGRPVYMTTPNFVVSNELRTYDSDLVCNCELTAPRAHSVYVEGLYLHIEPDESCSYDALRFSKERFCGEIDFLTDPLLFAYLPNRTVQFSFISDGDVEYRGAWFKLFAEEGASYTVRCDPDLEFTTLRYTPPTFGTPLTLRTPPTPSWSSFRTSTPSTPESTTEEQTTSTMAVDFTSHIDYAMSTETMDTLTVDPPTMDTPTVDPPTMDTPTTDPPTIAPRTAAPTSQAIALEVVVAVAIGIPLLLIIIILVAVMCYCKGKRRSHGNSFKSKHEKPSELAVEYDKRESTFTEMNSHGESHEYMYIYSKDSYSSNGRPKSGAGILSQPLPATPTSPSGRHAATDDYMVPQDDGYVQVLSGETRNHRSAHAGDRSPPNYILACAIDGPAYTLAGDPSDRVVSIPQTPPIDYEPTLPSAAEDHHYEPLPGLVKTIHC